MGGYENENHAAISVASHHHLRWTPLASGHLSRLLFFSTIGGFMGYVIIVFGGAGRMPYEIAWGGLP